MKALTGELQKTALPKFTLIELLVVVGIIMILMSMLMPSLGKARDLAKRISCAGNMKQLGLASISYADSYNSWLGLNHAPSTTYTYYVWHEFIAPFTGLGVNRTLVCPNCAPFKYSALSYLNSDRYHTYGVFRFWDVPTDYMQPGADGNTSFLRITKVASPSAYAHMGDTWRSDTKTQAYNFRKLGYVSKGGISLRHAGLANMWFLDGHLASPGKNELKKLGINYMYLFGDIAFNF